MARGDRTREAAKVLHNHIMTRQNTFTIPMIRVTPNQVIDELYTLDPRILVLLDSWASKSSDTETEWTITYDEDVPDVASVLWQASGLSRDKWISLLKSYPEKLCVLTCDYQKTINALEELINNPPEELDALDDVKWSYSDYSEHLENAYGCVFTFTYYKSIHSVEHLLGDTERETDRVVRLLALQAVEPAISAFVLMSYLAQTVEYDQDHSASASDCLRESLPCATAYGALCEKKAICYGVADAYCQLLRRVNISADIVKGKILAYPNLDYCWNMVKIDGESYHVDPTIAIQGGSVVYIGAFLLQDTMMLRSYAWNRALYSASDFSLNYDIVIRRILQNKESLLARGVPRQYLLPAYSVT